MTHVSDYPQSQQIMDAAYDQYRQHEAWSFRDFLDNLGSLQRDVVAVGVLDSQVCNGGFQQWVDNGYATQIRHTVGGLHRINTPTAKRVLSMLEQLTPYLSGNEEPKGFFGGPYWENDGDDDAWDELISVCHSLDDEYYGINEQLRADLEEFVGKERGAK